ncbi:MAG: tagatose 1,6-diphosphate aldolase [Chloroflexota bacterium]|nr:tagatose 1,6-diphosphate aldolase [Chloroflexota bacterium]
MTLTPGKIQNLEAVSNERGVISAAAMDQRGSLQKALKADGERDITPTDMEEFKSLVAEVLTPYASAILLDPEYGLPASKRRAPGSGLLLAYEESGYDNTQSGRLPDLLPHESAHRLKAQGANAVKVLIYYTPFEDSSINDIKHAFIERIGDECRAEDIPFFLEFIGYQPDGGDEKGVEYARKKPQIVAQSMEEFSKPVYGVDVLKVEVPVNMKFVSGTRSFAGTEAYSRQQAMEYFRQAAQAAQKPFIYLSAGVSNAEFTETLELANESGVRYAGVLCGRATWKDGIPVFAKEGGAAFKKWLETQGVENIKAVDACLKGASPWYSFYNVQSPEALNPAAVTHV